MNDGPPSLSIQRTGPSITRHHALHLLRLNFTMVHPINMGHDASALFYLRVVIWGLLTHDLVVQTQLPLEREDGA